MNSFTFIFQRFCSDFQNTNRSEHLWICCSWLSLCDVNKISAYKMELLNFMRWNFKINLEHKPLPFAITRYMCVGACKCDCTPFIARHVLPYAKKSSDEITTKFIEIVHIVFKENSMFIADDASQRICNREEPGCSTDQKKLFFLKVVSTTFLLVCFLCLKQNTCETRKSVFYFTSKALFVLEIIKF